MSLFMRRSTSLTAAAEVAPVPRGLILAMLFVMGVLGFLAQTDRQIPSLIIALCSIAGVMGLFLTSLRRPELPIYVMVAYLPFSKVLIGDFGGIMAALNLTNLLIVVLFVSWWTSSHAERRPLFEPHMLHLPIVLLVGWVLISFVRTTFLYGHMWVESYLSESLSDLKRWLDPIVIYFLFFHLVKDRQRWKTVVVLIMVGVTIAALMAIREYLTGNEGSSLESSRVGGIAGQPNILGAFFVYYMFLFAAFWLQRVNRPKAWGFLVPFLLCFRGIMVTFSRGAYVAFAQGVLGLTYFKNKFLFALAAGAIAFVVMNPSVLPGGMRYRLESTFRPQTQIVDPYGTTDLEKSLDESSAVRLMIWRGATQMIQKHPWFGIGLGRFPYEIREYLAQDRWIDAHNAYLITAAEFGVPALVLFVLILLVLFRITAVVYRRHPDPFIRATALGFLGGLSGLFMANMFGSRLNTTEVSGYFWILAALMARAHLWTREEMSAAQRAAVSGRRQPPRAAGIMARAARPAIRRLT